MRSFTEELLVLKSKRYTWHYSGVKLSSIFKQFVCPEENRRPYGTSDSSCKMQSMATLSFTVKYYGLHSFL